MNSHSFKKERKIIKKKKKSPNHHHHHPPSHLWDLTAHVINKKSTSKKQKNPEVFTDSLLSISFFETWQWLPSDLSVFLPSFLERSPTNTDSDDQEEWRRRRRTRGSRKSRV
jgi:hypothetical protein